MNTGGCGDTGDAPRNAPGRPVDRPNGGCMRKAGVAPREGRPDAGTRMPSPSGDPPGIGCHMSDWLTAIASTAMAAAAAAVSVGVRMASQWNVEARMP